MTQNGTFKTYKEQIYDAVSVEPLVSIYENFTPGGGENKWRGRQQKPVATGTTRHE